jgi:hypothetical protein
MDRRQFICRSSLLAGGATLRSLLFESDFQSLSKSQDLTSRNTNHGQKNEWFIDIGLRKQLFADDYIISERRDVTRELGKMTKVNEGRPIFDDAWWASTVLHDDRLFKMWYTVREQGFSLATEGTWSGAYAESEDGLRWTKKANVEGLPFLYGPVLIDRHETD